MYKKYSNYASIRKKNFLKGHILRYLCLISLSKCPLSTRLCIIKDAGPQIVLHLAYGFLIKSSSDG